MRWIDLNLDGIPVVTKNDMRLVPVVAVRQNVYTRCSAGPTHGSWRILLATLLTVATPSGMSTARVSCEVQGPALWLAAQRRGRQCRTRGLGGQM